jgi:hypothetical protein
MTKIAGSGSESLPGTDGFRKKFTNTVSFLFQIPPYRTYLQQKSSKNRKKNLDSYCFVTSFGL